MWAVGRMKDPAEGWEGNMKALLGCLLVMEDPGFCCWIALLGEAVRNQSPPPWERIWKPGSQGKGFVSGEMLSRWRVLRLQENNEFLNSEETTGLWIFSKKSTMRNVLMILEEEESIQFEYEHDSSSFSWSSLDTPSVRQRFWGVYEGYLRAISAWQSY